MSVRSVFGSAAPEVSHDQSVPVRYQVSPDTAGHGQPFRRWRNASTGICAVRGETGGGTHRGGASQTAPNYIGYYATPPTNVGRGQPTRGRHHAVGGSLHRLLRFSTATYDPEVHLKLGDLALDSHSNPSIVRITIKQSKTDPFRQGAHIFLGTTERVVCPVAAIIRYLGIRCPQPGPLFISSTGVPLTRAYLVENLQAALRQAGLEDTLYNGHSFRSGATTTAAQNGLEDSLIQTLGRWHSDAFKLYIKIPQEQLALVSRTLARSR